MINAGIRNRLKENIASNPSSSHSPRFSDLFIVKSSPEDSSLYSIAPRERQLEENEDGTFKKQNPDPRGSGLGGFLTRALFGACRKPLPVAQAVHVAEQWRPGRQACRIGEVRVEDIVTRRRLIYRI